MAAATAVPAKPLMLPSGRAGRSPIGAGSFIGRIKPTRLGQRHSSSSCYRHQNQMWPPCTNENSASASARSLRTHNRRIELHGQQRLSLPPVRAPDQAARRYRYGTAAGYRCACTGSCPVTARAQRRRTGSCCWRIEQRRRALFIVTFFSLF